MGSCGLDVAVRLLLFLSICCIHLHSGVASVSGLQSSSGRRPAAEYGLKSTQLLSGGVNDPSHHGADRRSGSTCPNLPPRAEPPPLLKALFLFNGPIGDLGWTYAAQQGRLFLQDKFREKILIEHVVVPDVTDEDRIKHIQIIHEYYARGFNLTVGFSFGFQDALYNTSATLTDMYFINISGYLTRNNMVTAFARIDQMRYLAGILAGKFTQAESICYVAAVKIPEVYRGLNAFAIGVKKANPTAKVHVMWTNTWYDPELEAYTARLLFNTTCCDIITQHADTLETPRVARDLQKWAIGYHSDMSTFLGERVLASVVWNWGPMLVDIVGKLMNNTWEPNADYWPGLEEDTVQLTQLSFKVPGAIKDAVNAEHTRLKTLPSLPRDDIFCGPIVNRSSGDCMSDNEIRGFDGTIDGPITGTGMQNYVANVIYHGNSVLPPPPCLLTCSGNGQCVNYACVCNPGYLGSNCDIKVSDSSNTGAIVGGAVGGGVGLLLVLLGFIAYQRSRTRKLLRDAWKIAVEDIEVKARRAFGSEGHVGRSQLSFRSRASKTSSAHAARGSVTVASHKGKLVALRELRESIDHDRMAINEMLRVRELDHANVVKVIGGTVAPPYYIVTEFVAKGTLDEILRNDRLPLDMMFKAAMAKDVARGMTYLHKMGIAHGGLHPSKVLLTEGFSCKIAGAGMPSIMALREGVEESDFSAFSKKLYQAPEVLEGSVGADLQAKMMADVYSYGIVLYEIVTRRYAFDGMDLDVEKKVQKVLETGARPDIEVDVEPRASALIRSCWDKDPFARPSFEGVMRKARALSPDGGSIIEKMLYMLQQYADNLEGLVEERTSELQAEKRRTDQLLYQMLPESVANDLRLGKPPPSEKFDAVTILFTDVVRFTDLSAKSEPIQIVHLLNRLYTCFDTILTRHEVYKVETIGDACKWSIRQTLELRALR
eukprot:Opistho-2@96390